MKLRIPSKDAIEILSKRKSEIRQSNFDPTVWKGKTENDLKEIFDLGDFKWTQINQIRFSTVLPEKKYEVFEKGRKQAEDFMQSYIEQIQNYSEIESRQTSENEKYFEEENLRLNQELSSTLHSSNVLLSERNDLIEQINLNNQTINHLKNNTVQLDKITLNKLFSLIKNLPLTQSIGLFSTFFAIIGFTFYLGNIVKENSYLKDDFNKQKEIDSLKQKNKSLENEKFKLSKEIKNLTKLINENK